MLKLIVLTMLLLYLDLSWSRFATPSFLVGWFFDINICGVWCCYSWPIGFLVKLLPVPEKQFQPNFNFCCGGRKKKKSRESERLDGIDNNPHETEQTNGWAFTWFYCSRHCKVIHIVCVFLFASKRLELMLCASHCLFGRCNGCDIQPWREHEWCW
jgi:hypothetical protein